MKTINLFLDMELTSSSADAQIISIGIVSDEAGSFNKRIGKTDLIISEDKSFYVEFTDFDINRCDDWVKENVVGNLKYKTDATINSSILSYILEENPDVCDIIRNVSKGKSFSEALMPFFDENIPDVINNVRQVSCAWDTNNIKDILSKWLSQFSNYRCVLNVKDYSCVYPLLKLIGVKYNDGIVEGLRLPDFFDSTINFLGEYSNHKTSYLDEKRGWNYDYKYLLKNGLKKHLNQMERDYGYESSDHEAVSKNLYTRFYSITYNKKNQQKHFTSLEGAMVLKSIYNRFFKSKIIFQ